MNHLFDHLSFPRAATAVVGALTLSACSGLVPAAQAPDSGSLEEDSIQIGTGREYPKAERPDANAGNGRRSSRQSLGISSAPNSYKVHPQDRACLADLGAAGARFQSVPDRYDAPGCNTLGAVRLTTLSGDRTQFAVSNLGPVKCKTATTFSAWARFGVDRAARELLGSPLVRIETMGSYSCRNILGTNRRSAHATGNAIDVSGFVLLDGRRIDLKSDWDGGTPAEREFLRVVHKSACKRFGTVLGPDYNAAHRDHFHLEGSGPEFCR